MVPSAGVLLDGYRRGEDGGSLWGCCGNGTSKRPRCLERVLAPESFPTTTTAAKVMMIGRFLQQNICAQEQKLAYLPLVVFFPVSEEARIGPTSSPNVAIPAPGLDFGVV